MRTILVVAGDPSGDLHGPLLYNVVWNTDLLPAEMIVRMAVNLIEMRVKAAVAEISGANACRRTTEPFPCFPRRRPRG